MNSPASDFERRLALLHPGDHVCTVHDSRSEQLSVLATLVREGLAQDEQCIVMASDLAIDDVAEALVLGEIAVSEALASGSLRLLTAEAAGFGTTESEPPAIIDFIAQAKDAALSSGFTGMRFVRQVTEGADRRQDACEVEMLLNAFVGERRRCVICCLCQRERVDPALLYDVVRTHPLVVLHESVCPNPYYEPPELQAEVQPQMSAAFKSRRGAWWLSRLAAVDRERAESSRRLAAYNALMSRIRNSLDAAEILASVHAVLTRLAPHSAHALLVYVESDDSLQLRYPYRLAHPLREAWKRLPVPGSVFEPLIRERAGSVSKKGDDLDGSSSPEPPWTLFAVPLAGGEEIQGILCVIRGSQSPFAPEQEEFIQMLGAQVGVVLHNASLYSHLVQASEQMRSLSHRLTEVRENERREIARELHDEVGQMLTALTYQLSGLELEAPTNMERIVRAKSLVDDLQKRVHDLQLVMRPPMLDDLGLLAALRWLCEQCKANAGMEVTFQHTEVTGRLPARIELAAYRIVQESLTNVARHAGVSSAQVRVWLREGSLCLQVTDGGRGFDPEKALQVRRTAGLAGLRERVALLEGHLEIESSHQSGTRITVELPLTSAEDPS